jgi:ketosteroid isomerase-like protein
MSQENVELIRTCYQAFARGDLDAVLEVVHPEFELRGTGRLPDVEQVRGHEAIRRYFGDLFSAFEEVRLEPESFIDAGDAVVVPVKQTMRGKGSGVELIHRLVVVWHVRDGMVTLGEAYQDKRAALEAVGLSE